jgi:hypothetical protein
VAIAAMPTRMMTTTRKLQKIVVGKRNIITIILESEDGCSQQYFYQQLQEFIVPWCWMDP